MSEKCNGKRIREEQNLERVGIQFRLHELINLSLFKFHARIKMFSSDFIVREISDDGLTFLYPTDFTERTHDLQKEMEEENKQVTPYILVRTFESLLNKKEIEKLIKFYIELDSDKEISELKFGPLNDKQQRTFFHQNIRQFMGKKVSSLTIDNCIVLKKINRREYNEGIKRLNASFPENYLHFTLYKENIDGTTAIRTIAKYLGISSRLISFCGTKDKRAVTLQRMSCKGISLERFKKFNEKSLCKYGTMYIGNFTKKKNGLLIGDLKGNHFTIVLRVLDLKEKNNRVCDFISIPEISRHILTNGFINYFGPQRFGTTSVLTCDIGTSFIRGNYSEGIRLILASRVDISPETKEMLDLYDSKIVSKFFNHLKPNADDYNCVLSSCPHYCFIERDILSHLSSFPNDFIGALMKIPRTTAMLYFHALQSLIWNQWVSVRLNIISPLQIQEGDIVFPKNSIYSNTLVDSAFSDKSLPNVHYISKEDIEKKSYSIFDVIMPVPGCDSALLYPELPEIGLNKEKMQKKIIDEGLGALIGINDEKSITKEVSKLFHFHGTYRNIIASVKDFSLERNFHEDLSRPLLRTDISSLKKNNEIASRKSESSENIYKGFALVARFSLPAGSYATSLLREFCNFESSVQKDEQ